MKARKTKQNRGDKVLKPAPPEALQAIQTSEPRPSDRKVWIALGVILILGLVLRVWYLAEVVHAPDFAAPQQDPSVQDYHARGIVTGDWSLPPGAEGDPEIRTTPYFRPPGHAYFLAAVYFFTHGSYLAPRIVNMALGLMAVVLMFLLGRAVYGRGAGLIAAFGLATYWGIIFWEGELNDPALFVFLCTALMYVLHRWAKTLTPRWAVLAGLIVGSYALMRPNILLFGPFIAVWMLWVGLRKLRGGKGEEGKRGTAKVPIEGLLALVLRVGMRLMPSWIALAFFTFLLIIPVTIRNYRVSGEFVPISTYFGENFLISNGPEADGVTPWTPYLQDLEGTGHWSVWVYINVVRGAGRELGIRDIKHSAASEYFYRQTLDYIKTHKWRTVKLMLKKAVLFWTPIEITCNKVVQYEKEFYPPLKYLPGFSLLFALFLLGLVWLVLDFRRARMITSAEVENGRRRFEMTAIILLFILVYFASFLLFFVNGRARVPIMPLCLLIGAYGAYRVFECAHARAYRKTAVWVAAFGALWALASIQYIPFVPDHSRWYYQRADSYSRIGEMDKAAAEAEHLLVMPETAAYMYMRLARIFEADGRTDLAFRLLMAALENYPSDPDVQFSGAAELINLGRIREGIDHYNAVLQIDPNDVGAHNNLGRLMEDQGQLDAALFHYREAVRLDPQYPLAQNNLGNLLAGLGRTQEAIESFAKAIEADPKHENYHYNLALQLANAGRVDKAIERYTIALQLDPDDARAHNNLGLLFAGQGRYDEARYHYDEALRVVPDFVLVYANIGNMLFDQGRKEEGVAAYQKGLEIRPGDAGLHNGIGYFYAMTGNTEKALEHYTEALRIAPDFPRAHNNLGNLLLRQGKTDEAIRHYRQALEIDPRDKNAYINLGNLYMDRRSYEEALACYTKALENDPGNPEVANALGNVLVRQARLDDAVKYYNLALQWNPKHLGAHCNLGNVLLLGKRYDEAIEHFQQALDTDPSNAVAREGLQKARAAKNGQPAP